MTEEPEYAPDPLVDWVIEMELPSPLTRAEADELTNRLHARVHGCTLYGRCVDTGLWTYAIALDSHGPWDALAFAWSYADARPGVFQLALQVVDDLGLAGTTTVPVSPLEAVARAAFLRDLVESIDGRLRVHLVAEEQFNRHHVHGALTLEGLLPTDGPMYEPGGEPGSYSVEVYNDVLLVTTSIPRAGIASFDAMMKLTGRLIRALEIRKVSTDGRGDPGQMRAHALDVETRMRAAGIEPGSDAALRLF